MPIIYLLNVILFLNIEGEKLEREHGKLIYSFDIRNSKGTKTEVQVDAKNGRLVSVEKESKQQETNEKRRDEKQEKVKAKKTEFRFEN